MTAGFGFEKPADKETAKVESFKTVSPKMTAEQWMDLRKKIANPDLYENPEKYQLDEHDIDKNWDDTLQKMLEGVFAVYKVPGDIQPVVSSILEGLEANGVDTKNFVKSVEADRWGFANGKLILRKGTKTVAKVDIFPWIAKEGAKYKVVGMDEYGRGVGHDADDENPYEDEHKEKTDNPYEDNGVTSVIGRKVDVLQGTVDAKGFLASERTEEWHRDKIKLSEALLGIYDKDKTRFDGATRAWIISNEKVLRDLAKPNTDIKKFEKNNPYENVFGSKGVYNLLLAFERALNSQSLSYHDYNDIIDKKIDISLGIGSVRRAQGYEMPQDKPNDLAV